MKRFIFAFVLLGFSTCAWGNTLERVMDMRNSVQERLNLSSSQEEVRKEINTNFRKEIEPQINKIDVYVNRIANIANSDDISREKIDSVRKEFEATETELSDINQKYEKEFRRILTPSQKIKYVIYKKQARTVLRKEIKEEIKRQRSVN